MAKYISLIKYTQKGAENIKDSPNRYDAFKQLCESMGAKPEGIYLTMGRYDLVVVLDAPNPDWSGIMPNQARKKEARPG